MPRQSVIPKKKRGPPPTGKGTPIMVRLQPPQLAALDQWIARQESARTRPEAIRHLMDLALSIGESDRPTSKAKAEKAAELAAHAIEKATDKSLLGFIGDSAINVLKLNLALDALPSKDTNAEKKP